MQRLFDIFFSGFAIILLSPILILLIILLKLTGEKEIFFLQERVGFCGKIFKVFKFVTMIKNSSNLGYGTITLRNDPRILPLGKILRKTKLNELPQLLNIFKGEMSFIGPRPQTSRCFKAFPKDCQTEIIKVRPGLSGIGSIIFKNEEFMMNEDDKPDKFYDEVIMPYKGTLEKWYVSNRGIFMYFYLLIMTLIIIFGFKPKFFKSLFRDFPAVPQKLKKWIKI